MRLVMGAAVAVGPGRGELLRLTDIDRGIGRRHGNPFLGRDVMEDRDYSEEVAQAIDEEVRGIMDRNYQRARHILVTHREKMDQIVAALMVRETIEREEFLRLMQGAIAPEQDEAPAPPAAPPNAEVRNPEVETPRPRIEPRFRPEPGPA